MTTQGAIERLRSAGVSYGITRTGALLVISDGTVYTIYPTSEDIEGAIRTLVRERASSVARCAPRITP